MTSEFKDLHISRLDEFIVDAYPIYENDDILNMVTNFSTIIKLINGTILDHLGQITNCDSLSDFMGSQEQFAKIILLDLALLSIIQLLLQ